MIQFQVSFQFPSVFDSNFYSVLSCFIILYKSISHVYVIIIIITIYSVVLLLHFVQLLCLLYSSCVMGDFDLHAFMPLYYICYNFSILLGYFDLCKYLWNVSKNSNSNEHCQHYHHHYRSFIYVVALLSHPQGIFVYVMEGIAVC